MQDSSTTWESSASCLLAVTGYSASHGVMCSLVALHRHAVLLATVAWRADDDSFACSFLEHAVFVEVGHLRLLWGMAIHCHLLHPLPGA